MRDTIELCKEAGFPLMVFEGVPYVSPELERLVALVRADERSASVQVSPLEFITMVMEKEHLVGKPLFWAEWPNKEKNT